MGKRKSVHSQSHGHSPNKRQRSAADFGGDDDESGSTSRYGTTSARLNPEYGQKGAFPGLDNDAEDPLFYGPASDGLEYLRMVRSEAKTVPRVVVAQPAAREKYGNTRKGQEWGGWYADGAYTAEPAYEEDCDSDDLDAQEAYYKALLARFWKLREALSIRPFTANTTTINSPDRLDALQLAARHSQWDYCFRQIPPQARALAAASYEDVIRALSRIETVFTKRNMLSARAGRNIGAWLWSLLARCRDIGQMDSDHISIIRGLAKTALVVGYKIKCMSEDEDEPQLDEKDLDEAGVGQEPGVAEDSEFSDHVESLLSTHADVAAEGHGQVGGASETGNGALNGAPGDAEGHYQSQESGEDEESLEKSRQALLMRLGQVEENTDEIAVGNKIQPESGVNVLETRLQAIATIDIVVTLVGEVFGQRDLLDRRDAWI